MSISVIWQGEDENFQANSAKWIGISYLLHDGPSHLRVRTGKIKEHMNVDGGIVCSVSVMNS